MRNLFIALWSLTMCAAGGLAVYLLLLERGTLSEDDARQYVEAVHNGQQCVTLAADRDGYSGLSRLDINEIAARCASQTVPAAWLESRPACERARFLDIARSRAVLESDLRSVQAECRREPVRTAQEQALSSTP